MSEKQAPHVEQALAEQASAVNAEQARAAAKRLAAAGYEAPDAGEGDTEAKPDRSAPPKGRSTRQQNSTTA